MPAYNGLGGISLHTGSSGASHGGIGGSFSNEVSSPTIPNNSSSPSSSVGIASGGLSGIGSSDYLDMLRAISNENNAFNLRQTEMVNAFNAAEAQKLRDWQERLSNTAHQREVADLQKAGLNPVLSALNGNGAAVGNGASASGQKAVADNTLGNGIISLMSAMINASSAASVASIYANASMYAADLGHENNIYTNATNRAIAKLNTSTSSRNNTKSNITKVVGDLLPWITKVFVH